MQRVLITGATGFVGSHLIDFLLNKGGVEIYGCKRRRSAMSDVDHIKDKVKWVEMEITDTHSVRKAIDDVEPEVIFHLAGQSFVPTSFTAPQETMNINVGGTINVLEAMRQAKVSPVIQIAGSSEEYGFVLPEEVPIKETNPLRPLSPYGVSKVAEDLLGWQYFRSYGVKAIRTRAFNHEGPRRGEVFVTSNFARQVAEMEKGLREPVMSVGNLNAKRDFSDVRDVVRAYWLAATKCRAGEAYNICSGKARTIQSMLDFLLSLSSKKGIQVKQDPARMRPSDVENLQGDCSKFQKETGWKLEIPFEKTMEDLLNWWRGRL